MTDDRYVDGEQPIIAEAVVKTTHHKAPAPAPVYQAVEAVRRPHRGLIPLAIASLLGLLSLFLPYAGYGTAGTDRFGTAFAATDRFSFWRLANGQHHWILILLLLTAALALIAYFTRADWARYVAGVLGLGTGLWLLIQTLGRFSHAGLGNFFGTGLTGALTSGIGRWIMLLAGLALLATAIWSFLRNAGDTVENVVR